MFKRLSQFLAVARVAPKWRKAVGGSVAVWGVGGVVAYGIAGGTPENAPLWANAVVGERVGVPVDLRRLVGRPLGGAAQRLTTEARSCIHLAGRRYRTWQKTWNSTKRR